MLKGDLTSTPLAPLLLDLAADSATGCLSVSDADGDEALVYLKGGLVYAISVPGSRPQLGAKLVSSGALAPEALSEALEAQRTELQGWRLGELLVHLGYVDQPVVEAFVKEQVHEALWDLMRWGDGRWRFRKNSKTREDVGPPMVVVELLESLRERGYEWETISAVVHGPNAVPMLSARGDSAAETTLDNDAWSMLCKIDGQRTVSELARDCGYTLFEAGHVIVSLVQAGLVDIDEDIDVEGGAMYGASTLTSALAGEDAPDELDDDDAMTRLAKLVTEVAGEGSDDPNGGSGDPVAPAQRQPEPDLDHSLTVPLHRGGSESFAASIARVSGALSDVLGPPQEAVDDIDPLLETRKVTRPARDENDEDSEWERRRRMRSAAAAELVNAQALADALRPDRNVNPELPSEDPPRLIDEAKAAKHAQEEADRHAAEEAAREAAERFARAAAEEAERLAAEQEAARLAAEEAQRLAAEDAARAAAEQAAQAEAEALAAEAERQATAEAERVAAQEAEAQAAEAARLTAEAAQLAAEVEAAELEAWTEYWQREEAERAAREAAEREAAEQAAREEAERLAAEQAAQAEAERLAAELAEVERVAAEQAAAQAEADRVAAEEAARLEAEHEAERKVAEKAERAAQRKAEKAAAAEAARREDEAAAAHAMLIELNASANAEPVEPDPVEAVAPEPAEEPEPAPQQLPVPVGVGASAELPEMADTAALLRELSSLGLEDDDQPQAQAQATRASQRPVVDDKKPRKKIGLFGL